MSSAPDPEEARTLRSKLSQLYNESAPDYEELWAPELLPLSRQLLPRLPLESARTVLDAGAGVGTLLPELQENAPLALVVGNDLSPGMVSRAPRDIARVAGDAGRLPFIDDAFDVAILAFVLFHLFDPRDGLAETARVLRPGGVVGTITWGAENDPAALQVWADELSASGAPPVETSLAKHELLDTPAKLETMMERAGLEPIVSWVGEYRSTTTLDQFLDHRIRHGQSRRRLQTLAPPDRTECVARARRRLEALSPDDFTEISEVVYAVARTP